MKTLFRIVAAVMIAAVIVGCSSKNDVSFDKIAGKPAPELSSTADRSVDVKSNYAYMRNTNYRGFWDDLQRSLYIDNPSRLSPYPIIDASGNPR
jgi:hypothetical protein